MMRGDTKQWLVLVLHLHIVFGLSLIMQKHGVEGEEVPCVFIFGDSLSDSGNNNALLTAAKVNYKPYGIDFADGPTGRFTNGRTSIDIITQLLGFKNLIPPFANISNSDILQGVNYASGAAGIRIETGTHLGVDISLGLQLNHHRVIVSQIAAKYGSFEKAQTQLNKCLYYLNIGSNDYINNYFMPNHYLTSRFFTLEDYTLDLITKYSLTLRELYKLGARKFVTVGVGYIGCTPNSISTLGKNSSSCVEEMNNAALIFNSKLKSLVDEFNNQLSTTNAKFIFINSTAVNLDPSLGFKVLDAGCCKVGEIGQCVANEKPCENRNEYVFYDGFHPTEALNVLTAIASYNASNPAFTYPMDISHLILS